MTLWRRIKKLHLAEFCVQKQLLFHQYDHLISQIFWSDWQLTGLSEYEELCDEVRDSHRYEHTVYDEHGPRQFPSPL